MLRKSGNQNNKYNKRRTRKIGVGPSSKSSYKLDGEEVTQEDFEEYEKGYNFHRNRFDSCQSQIILKNNLVLWITRHYKQDDFENPIPKLQEEYYEIMERNNRNA